MKVLQETTDTQTLSFIPRIYPSYVNYIITNEETNISVSKENVETLQNGGYLEIDDVFELKQGVFYNIDFYYNSIATEFENLVIEDSGTYEINTCFNTLSNEGLKLIYRGRIFCSNQSDLEKFTMNENKYTEDNTYNNEYVIYGQ